MCCLMWFSALRLSSSAHDIYYLNWNEEREKRDEDLAVAAAADLFFATERKNDKSDVACATLAASLLFKQVRLKTVDDWFIQIKSNALFMRTAHRQLFALKFTLKSKRQRQKVKRYQASVAFVKHDADTYITANKYIQSYNILSCTHSAHSASMFTNIYWHEASKSNCLVRIHTASQSHHWLYSYCIIIIIIIATTVLRYQRIYWDVRSAKMSGSVCVCV